jgi:hypothetical protein
MARCWVFGCWRVHSTNFFNHHYLQTMSLSFDQLYINDSNEWKENNHMKVILKQNTTFHFHDKIFMFYLNTYKIFLVSEKYYGLAKYFDLGRWGGIW